MALILKDGAPKIVVLNDRRYTVCNEPVMDLDGNLVVSPFGNYCGALIDVTGAKGIKATDSCGCDKNHVFDDGPVVGF